MASRSVLSEPSLFLARERIVSSAIWFRVVAATLYSPEGLAILLVAVVSGGCGGWSSRRHRHHHCHHRIDVGYRPTLNDRVVGEAATVWISWRLVAGHQVAPQTSRDG